MYKIEIKITNPITKHERTKEFQFDPLTWDEASWTEGWPIIQQEIAALLSLAEIAEPVIWDSQDTKFGDTVTAATSGVIDVVATP